MRINYTQLIFLIKRNIIFFLLLIVISILQLLMYLEIKNIIALKMIMLRFLLLMPGRQKKETYLHYI